MTVFVNANTTVAGGSQTYAIQSAGKTITHTGTLSASGTGIEFIAANGVLINSGKIVGGPGVYFNSGGSGSRVTNTSGATIVATSGTNAIRGAPNVTGTIVNYGLISKPAVDIYAAIQLSGGGAITNNAGGTIVGGGIYVNAGASATVVNAGTISGGTGQTYGAIALYGGGLVTNLSGGTITAGGASNNFGVKIKGAAGTVSNAGTIVGGSGGGGNSNAVYFANVSGNRLIDFPTGVFTGLVQGQGGATLELGSGASTGTLSSLGSQFTGFATITIDSGASWAWAATDTLASGVTLTDSGTLINGVTLTPTGRINLSGGVFSNASTGTLAGSIYGIGSGTVINAGKITGNVVEITGFTNRVAIDPGAIFSGTVNGGNASTAAGVSTLELRSSASAGTLTSFSTKYLNFSQIAIDAGARWNVGSTDVFGAGISLTNVGTLATSGTVTVSGPLANSGTVLVGTGALTINTLSGAGTLAFNANSGAILAMSSAAASVQKIDGLTIASGTISGQTIEIVGQTVTTAVIDSGTTLALGLSGGGSLNIQLATAQTGKFFQFQTSGGNTFLELSTAVCYLAGTRILTDKGEIPVEDLAIGDRAVTFDGIAKSIKWIGRRAYSSAFAAGNRDVIPILIKKGALADNVPLRDLYVSPLHAMYVDDVLVPAGNLVNGTSISRCPEIDPIRYFHIELENHDVIFAEGAPAETFIDCDSRGIFHNASTFGDLYPGDSGRRWVSCAPRIESGPVFERIRRAIDARSGSIDAAPGALEGNFDGLDGNTISGWAFDPAHPEIPVVLEVLDGDGLIARLTANRFRADLEAAGVGDGRHGFELKLARPLSPLRRHELRVRRAIDRRELAGSPLVSEPLDRRSLVKDTGRAIDLAMTGASQDGALDGLLDTLLSSIDKVRRLRATQPIDLGDDRLLVPVKPHRAKAKVALVVSELLPRRDRDTASDAVLSHIGALRSLGWDVEVVASAELARGDDAAASLKAWGVTCHRAPLVASVEEVLRRKRGFYDMVYLHRTPNAEAYASLVRAWQAKAHVVYATGDGPASIFAMRMADTVVAVTEAEAERLRQPALGLAVQVVPWSPRAASRLPLHARNGVALVGASADALRWLNAEVLPLVRRRDPEIQVQADLDRARVSVAVDYGSALTSFAAGVPCAMTRLAANGLSLDRVLRSAVTEDAQTMAALICDLHNRESLNTRHAEAGLALVRGGYTDEAVVAALEALVGRGIVLPSALVA